MTICGMGPDATCCVCACVPPLRVWPQPNVQLKLDAGRAVSFDSRPRAWTCASNEIVSVCRPAATGFRTFDVGSPCEGQCA
eukprot:856743-Prymnesium_polylepis.1